MTFGGFILEHDGQLHAVLSDGTAVPLWAAPKCRYLHDLDNDGIAWLADAWRGSATTSILGQWKSATVRGEGKIAIPVASFLLRGFRDPTGALDDLYAINHALDEQDLPGLSPAAWIGRLPIGPPCDPEYLYQGPTWARKRFVGRAVAFDATAAYLTSAKRLRGQRIYYGDWMWRPKRSKFGALPVKCYGGVVAYPGSATHIVRAVLSDATIALINTVGELRCIRATVSEFPTTVINAERVHPLLRKAAYVRWWGGMCSTGTRTLTGEHDPCAMFDGSVWYSEKPAHGRRLLWGAAIAWDVAVRTGALAARLNAEGQDVIATHIDCVIVAGEGNGTAVPQDWRAKEQGVVDVRGVGVWAWYVDGVPGREFGSLSTSGHRPFKVARMSEVGDAEDAMDRMWYNGDARKVWSRQ